MESYRISKHMNEYFDELFGMEEKNYSNMSKHSKRGRAKILSLELETEWMFYFLCFTLLWVPFLWKGIQHSFVPNTMK
jgi:hypothetical protein